MTTLTAILSIVGLGLTTSAGADEITSGELEWGFKSSWQNYIVNVPPPLPPSSITTATPASASGTAPNQVYEFPAATGVYQPDAPEIDAAFGGSVRFSKPAHGIDIELTEMRLSVTGATGTIISDVVSSGTTHDDAELATLDLTGIAPSGEDGTVTYTAVPATGTDDNVAIFGQYGPGTAMDPVTFSISYEESPAGEAPTISAISGTQGVGKNGKLRVARVFCGATECEVSAPSRATVSIAGRKRNFKLSAPSTLGAGERAVVRGKLRAGLVKRLTKRKRKVRVSIAVAAGLAEVERTVAVRFRAR